MHINNLVAINSSNYGNRYIRPENINTFKGSEINDLGNTNSAHLPTSVVNSKKAEIVKKALDDKVFEFELSDGSKMNGTVKEYLKACILGEVTEGKYSNLIHGTSAEAREEILKNGFSSNKISRTAAGPGTCFGPEGTALDVGGGATLSCKFEGKIANFTDKFYSQIESNKEIVSIVDDVLEIGALKKLQEGKFSEWDGAYTKVLKAIGEYTREVLVKGLGIDASNYHGDRTHYPCFVVYNTDKLSDIEKYHN